MVILRLPPLGYLPLERYVLAHWNSNEQGSHDERRRRLARAFVQLGEAGRVPYVVNFQEQPDTNHLPESEWQDVLSPLRTDAQREYALPKESFGFGIIWLRTCYHGDSDEKHQKLLRKLNSDVALDLVENILNDPALYDFGDDWSRIFEIMPERLFTIYNTWENADQLRQWAQKQNEKIRQAEINFEAGIFDTCLMEIALTRQQAGKDRPETDDEIAASVYRVKTRELHSEAMVNYLFIADNTAMETGKVLVVFFDDCGRSVRQARIQPDLCEDTAGAWADFHITEQPEFDEADIGPDYLPGGARGPPYPTVSTAFKELHISTALDDAS